MANRLYALLVGINDYPADVGKLAGCLNDVDHFHSLLGRQFGPADLAVEVLKDADATRRNVIAQFRGHLGRAGEGDVAVFHYCGHGARWASAAAFREFYPDGQDEGLVCIDSRNAGGFDLADKELAVLVADVARAGAHVAVILDCCHSGSGTRGVDAFRGLRPRVTQEVVDERPLDSYLDGYYAALRARQEPLSIPAGRHILLSACERTQLAQETADRSGVFTSTLVDVLDEAGGDLTYADLFARCRAAVRKRARNQDPQFETLGSFDAWSGFLGRRASRAGRRYRAYFDGGGWKLDCGAIHGVPADADTPVTLALYAENDPGHPAGTASTLEVGAQQSTLKLDFASDPALRYRAQITSLPVAPLQVYCRPDTAYGDALQRALERDGSVNALLTGVEAGTAYALGEVDGALELKSRDTDRVIQWAALSGTPDDAAAALLPILQHVARWERLSALANPRTQLDPALVDFRFAERLDDGQEHPYPAGEIVLDFAQGGGEWQSIYGRLVASNRTRQTLHLALLYFSDAYGITVFKNDPIGPGVTDVTLWGGDAKGYFYLPDTQDETIEIFKLFVSTERLDDYLLTQKDLELGGTVTGTRALGNFAPAIKKVPHQEWFTKDCRIRVVRRLDRVGANDVAIAAGKILVKGHPTVTANLSLAAANPAGRGAASGADFHRAFAQQGIDLVNFAGTRGEDASILELTDIRNAASLAEQPLRIEIHVPLTDDEAILPFVYDGRWLLLGGHPYKDPDGSTHVDIDHIPEGEDRRRSLGSSLKLYFFKTCLKLANVNRLRWVEYRGDGSCAYHDSLVADKVAAARNVLLLVHGIIGDTEGMAQGVRACGLDARFDLVLTYDYENLRTPIAETARLLGTQLKSVGLSERDDKRLTLLAHSMGGLVARWFIEREGGNRVVDHLVMCGTPNDGSPFGKIDGARRILTVLTGLSMNYLPALVPFNSAVLLLLNGSKAVTPTLQQMDPTSEFIRTLNASDDPEIAYTILAGDIDAYREPSDRLFAKLLVQAGQSYIFEALFAEKPNDIAVGVDSILGVAAGDRVGDGGRVGGGGWVGGRRAIPADRRTVACHHLNYFLSDGGQQALTAVRWQ